MDKTIIEDFAQEWISAWNSHDLNSHDLDEILSHYADKIEYVSPLVIERYDDATGTITNKEKLKKYIATGLAANPKLKLELVQVLLGVRGFVLYYKNARDRHSAEYFELNDKQKVTKVIATYS